MLTWVKSLATVEIPAKYSLKFSDCCYQRSFIKLCRHFDRVFQYVLGRYQIIVEISTEKCMAFCTRLEYPLLALHRLSPRPSAWSPLSRYRLWQRSDLPPPRRAWRPGHCL